MLSCLMVVTACIGPHKPVPTQRSKSTSVSTEAEPPQERVDRENVQTGLAPMGAVIPLPVPPLAQSPVEASGTPSAQAEVPVVDVKPVLVIAQSEPYKVSQANTATKTDTAAASHSGSTGGPLGDGGAKRQRRHRTTRRQR